MPPQTNKAQYSSSENELIKIPKWLYGLIIAAAGWAIYISIQITAVSASVHNISEITKTIRAHDTAIATLLQISENQEKRIDRLQQEIDRLHRAGM